jgi:hypothetical protein
MKKLNAAALIAALFIASPAAAQDAEADLSGVNPEAGTIEAFTDVSLDDLETVAVQPVAFTTTTTRREAEVMFSTLSSAEGPDADVSAIFEGVDFSVSAPAEGEGGEGLDFAGSSTEADTNALTMGFGLGTLPLMQLQSAETFKATVANLESLAPAIDTMFSPKVGEATRAFLATSKAGKFDVNTYTAMLASATLGMASSDDPSVQRRHGYLLVGLWMGYSILSAATDSVTESHAQIGDTLTILLVKDASYGSSDKRIAAVVKSATDDLKGGKATASSLMGQAKKMLAVKADSAK